jgi:hypothetical protein
MNKTELFIQIPNAATQSIRFSDTYLASSSFGLFLGLEFSYDVSGDVQVGDQIYIDKDDKSFNTWIDGPATIIGITYSSIYATPSTLIFTDRPLQLPIVFTSSESGSVYLDNNIQNNWQEVELSDNVAFPITFNIADVREINNRNGAYSKTLQIPGTKVNNDVFKYIFDIQGLDNYDTRIKVKCNVVVDTIPVLEGYIQLNNIIAKDNKYWTYDCTIFGENANFSKEIDQNARLEDLDFSDLNHDFTIDAITQSWVENWNYGYYYPLIDFNGGQKPNLKRLFFIENFRGSIYAKQYWDRIFKSYGYTYESEFLNSDAFTNLIIPPTKKFLENDPEWRFNSTFRAGITQSATFSTTYPWESIPTQDPFLWSIEPVNINIIQENLRFLFSMDENNFPNADPGNNFFPGISNQFYYKYNYDNSYNISQKIIFKLDYEIKMQLFKDGQVPPPGFLAIDNVFNGNRVMLVANIYKNGSVITESYGRKLLVGFESPEEAVPIDAPLNNLLTQLYGPGQPLDIPYTGTPISPGFQEISLGRRTGEIVIDTNLIPIEAGDEIEIKLNLIHLRKLTIPDAFIGSFPNPSFVEEIFNFLNQRAYIEFFPTTNGQDGTYIFNEVNSQLFDGQPVLASEFVARNIKQVDFLNSIIKMFNLYLYQDKNNPKKIFIEPRDRFYDTTQFLNWSNKLDIDKEIIQTPIVERYKRILMSYKEDKDFYNASYKSLTNEIYGQFEYLTGDELSNSEKKIDLIFSPTPLNMWSLNDQVYDNSFFYSRIFDPNQPITSENFLKVESNIRILYRKTLPVNEASKLSVWNGEIQYIFDNYPYAGHLDDPTNPGLDLSFFNPKILFYKSTFFYTNNNLYNEYYKQFFEEIYGVNSKLITAYVYLNAQDILDFDYRKLIYIDNISSGSPGYFRVNRIEWDPFNKQSYKVELIKVLNNTKSTYNKIISIGTVTDLPGAGDGLQGPGNLNNGGGNIIDGLDNFSEGKNNLLSGERNIAIGSNLSISGDINVIQGKNNSIIGGRLNNVSSNESSIISGASNSISGNRSVIVGGYNNIINNYSSSSFIINGYSNKIGMTNSINSQSVVNSSIIGGYNNIIYSGTTQSSIVSYNYTNDLFGESSNNFIISGSNNKILPGLSNSMILNGQNVTIAESNTTYLGGNVFINNNLFSGSLAPIKYATYSLTDTEIKNSFTSPVTIITGATGIAYIPTMIVWETNYNTLQYTTNTNVIIKAVGADDPIIQQNGLLAFTYSGIAVSQGLAVGSYQTQAVRGADIQFSTLTGNPATGNGTILLTLYYIEI